MTRDTSPPASRPSPRRRLFRQFLFFVAAFITLIAVGYAVEYWRGRRAWDQCEQKLQRQGAVLAWSAYIPARVPDEQNFIKTPLLEAIGYRGRVDTNVWRSFNGAGKALVWDAWGDPSTGQKIDWSLYQSELRRRTNVDLLPLPQSPAADLLQALRGVAPQLEELRGASLRPMAQFDIDRTAPFEESPDFNFVAIRTLCQLLEAHACAEVTLGHSETAFADVRAIHRLADGLKNENTLVAFMMRVAIHGLALHPFWEGWTEERWSDRELAQFQELYERVDLFPEFSRVMSTERAGVIGLIKKYAIERDELWHVTMRSDGAPKNWQAGVWQGLQKFAWKLTPRGWVYQNMVAYSSRMDIFLQPSFRAEPPRISPAEMEELEHRMEQNLPRGPYGWLSRSGIPNGSKALQTLTRGQASITQARLVCALERFKASRGHYPDSLADLSPAFITQLPIDPISGKPPVYRRNSDGRFLLYSVGWNATDDGGHSAVTRDQASKADFAHGDWVWRYPVGRR